MLSMSASDQCHKPHLIQTLKGPVLVRLHSAADLVKQIVLDHCGSK